MVAEKICNKCQKLKSISEFHKDKSFADGLHYRCKDCKRSYKTKYDEVNRVKNNAVKRAYKSANKDKVKSWALKSDYGITKDQYDAMMSSQNGLCPICGKSQSDSERAFAVDHCHKTGKVRGLLCNPCNRAIGLLKDNAEFCNNAAKWLRSDDV